MCWWKRSFIIIDSIHPYISWIWIFDWYHHLQNKWMTIVENKSWINTTLLSVIYSSCPRPNWLEKIWVLYFSYMIAYFILVEQYYCQLHYVFENSVFSLPYGCFSIIQIFIPKENGKNRNGNCYDLCAKQICVKSLCSKSWCVIWAQCKWKHQSVIPGENEKARNIVCVDENDHS